MLRLELRNGGYDLSLAEIRDHMKYLAEKDKQYIELKHNEQADLYVAEITGRGRDLIDGMIFDPGVSENDQAKTS